MFPDIATIPGPSGSMELHTYGLFLTLAFIVAILVTLPRMRRVGLNSDQLVPLMALAIPAAIAGARLLHFLLSTDRAAFLSNPLIFFSCAEGGMAFLGGAIAATAVGLAYARWVGMDVLKLADASAPSILLGLSVGRLGCFAAGCCHGQACGAALGGSLTGGLFPGGEIVTVDGFPWVALVFKAGVGVGSLPDVPLYPTQLWESLGALALFGLLSWMWRSARRFDGQILAAAMVAYPLLRTTIEMFRGDALRGAGYFGYFSTSQLVSFGLIPLALALVAWRWGKGVAPETPLVYSDALPEDV